MAGMPTHDISAGRPAGEHTLTGDDTSPLLEAPGEFRIAHIGLMLDGWWFPGVWLLGFWNFSLA